MWKALSKMLLCTSALVLMSPAMSWAENLGFPFVQTLTLTDLCTVFNTVTSPGITRITYGEPIDFNLNGSVQSFVHSDKKNAYLKLQIKIHGDGIGQTSGYNYRLDSKVSANANEKGWILSGPNPTDPNFNFKGIFKVDARIIRMGDSTCKGMNAISAQDNEVVHFSVNVNIVNGNIQTTSSDFSLECVPSPWSNLMLAPVAGDKKKSPVGRGFGDPWNKYTWSMKDSNGGMLVGTKNAFYDIMQYISPSGAVKNCIDNNLYQVTSIHQPLACMELFASPADVGSSSVAADTRYAEIWRFDYAKKTWSKVLDDQKSEGYRIMEKHNNKVYAGSDLGAFITGVDLHSGVPGAWNFPGSRLLASTDGINFFEDVSCVNSGPCTSANGLDNPYGLIGTNPAYTGAVNTSIRSLASFNGKLYVGTFNAMGGQLWAYDDVSHNWTQIPITGVNPYNPLKPAIMELRVFQNKLFIGVAGPASNSYLYSYDGVSGSAVPVAGQPPLAASNVGVIKLFASSKGLLYIGNTDLTLGFSLMSYDGTSFNTITSNGFDNSNNAYAWSMAEINGRIFVGTFNQDFVTELPRGGAELWYSDTPLVWQEMILPLDFGPWNYGIRNMELGNKLLFLGTASNMVAPDLISQPIPLQPGTEVWTIQQNVAAPTGNKGH